MNRYGKRTPLLLALALAGLFRAHPAPAQTSSSQLAQRPYEVVQSRATAPAQNAPASSHASRGRTLTNVLPGQYGARSALSTALIVLSEQTEEQALAALTEDLNIMCRILDRTLSPDDPTPNDIFRHVLLGENMDQWIGRLFADHPSWTECLYVQGYGPLFLVNVDFPLLPPPPAQGPVEADPNAPRDPLWAQVSRELRADGGNAEPPARDATVTFSPEKVLALKTALTKALRHAVNIRGLTRDSNVTIMVRSRHIQRGDMLSLFAASNETPAEVVLPMVGDLTHPSGRSSRLVIRAATADIQAFASGDISFADFERRVETTQY